MIDARDDLLTPSLGNATMARAPYSERAVFVTGILGGPLAGLAMIALNSYRLRRLQRDAAALAGLFLAVLLLVYWLLETKTGAHVATLVAVDARRGLRLLVQIAGFLMVGAGHLLHRREQRSAQLMGLPRPNGWIAGIICVVINILVMSLFIFLLELT